MSEVGPRAEAGRGVQLAAKRSADGAGGAAQQESTGHQGSIVEAEAAQRLTDVTSRCLGPVGDVCGHGRQLFTQLARPSFFRSFLAASPDGSSGALGDNSQGSLGAVSDPCEQQNFKLAV